MKLKVLNLYAGLGGNRQMWPNDKMDVTAIENNPQIAAIYQTQFPNDKVIITDAHKYLLDHYLEYDFIWSSPPCQTHSKMQLLQVHAGRNKAVYPDMALYQEVLLLSQFIGLGKFVIENTIGYYEPLIKPQTLQRHYFWSNRTIQSFADTQRVRLRTAQIPELQQAYNIDLSLVKIPNKRQLLRNMVDPFLGRHVFNSIFPYLAAA